MDDVFDPPLQRRLGEAVPGVVGHALAFRRAWYGRIAARAIGCRTSRQHLPALLCLVLPKTPRPRRLQHLRRPNVRVAGSTFVTSPAERSRDPFTNRRAAGHRRRGGPCCAPRRTFSKSRSSRGVDAGSGVCGGPSRRVGADVSKPQGVQADPAGGGAVGRPNRRVSTVGGNIDAVAVKYADAECIEVPRLRPENPQSIRETRGHVSRAFFSAVTPR